MAGGRPPKPIHLVQGHRTKAEIEIRKKAEEALLTGTSLKEWKDTRENPIAHKEFLRLRKLFRAIEKDDALYEGIINRYCILLGECKEFETLRGEMIEEMEALDTMNDSGEIDAIVYLREKGRLQDRIMRMDRIIMDKRKMMFDIEKENIMTIQSSLRSIPKKPPKEEESPMAAFLKRKQGINGA